MNEQVQVEFGASIGGLTAGVQQVASLLEGLVSPIAGLTSAFATLGEALIVALGVEKIAQFAENMADLGERAMHTADMLGITVESLTSLQAGFVVMGMGADGATSALTRLERSLSIAQLGTGRQADAFRAMGVSTTDAEGRIRPLDEVLRDMAVSFSTHEGAAQKVAIVYATLGRGASGLIPYLNRGAEGMDEWNRVARETGSIMSEQTAKGMEQTSEKMHELSLAITGMGIKAFELLKPVIDVIVVLLIKFIEAITTLIGKVKDFKDFAVEMMSSIGAANKEQIESTVKMLEGQLDIQRRLADIVKNTNMPEWWKAGQLDPINKEMARLNGMLDNQLRMLREINQYGKTSMLGGATPETSGLGPFAGGHGAYKPEMEDPNKMAEARKELAADAQARLAIVKARVAEEDEITKSSYAQGLIDLNTFIAQQKSAENELYAAKVSSLNQQLKAAEDNKITQIKLHGEIQAAALEHQTKLVAIDQQGWNDRTKNVRDAAQRQIDIINDRYQQETALVKDALKNHEITLSQETSALIAEEDKRFANVQLEMQRELATYGVNSQGYEDMLVKMQKARIDHEKTIQQINQQSIDEQRKVWDSYTRNIESSFGTAITDMITKQSTLVQAEQRIGQAIVSDMVHWTSQMIDRWLFKEIFMTTTSQAGATARSAVDATSEGSFIGKIGTMLAQWLGFETAKTTASVAGGSARVAAETAEQVAGRALAIMEGFSQISIDAAVAAAGAMAAISMIPYVGPALAPVIAAETYAVTLGFAAGLGGGVFAEGAYEIGAETFGLLHPGEMVLPATVAEGVRSGGTGGQPTFASGLAAAGGAASGGGGAPTVNVTFVVPSIDQQGVARFFKNNGRMIADVTARQIRNANQQLMAAVKPGT